MKDLLEIATRLTPENQTRIVDFFLSQMQQPQPVQGEAPADVEVAKPTPKSRQKKAEPVNAPLEQKVEPTPAPAPVETAPDFQLEVEVVTEEEDEKTKISNLVSTIKANHAYDGPSAEKTRLAVAAVCGPGKRLGDAHLDQLLAIQEKLK